MRMLLAGLALLLARPAQDEDRLAIDSVTEDFQRRWAKAEEEKDWAEILKLYEGAVERTPNRLAQPDPDVRRWLRMPAVLGDRLATILPEGARESREILAQQLLDTLPDREARVQVIEKYGYTRAGRRAIEQAANEEYDEGRLREAIRGWSRAMETRLSPDLVARLAHAHAAAGDPAALSALRVQAERLGCKGEITVGGRKRDLHDFLALLQSSSAAPAPAAAPLLKPSASALPSTELSLGILELKGDGGSFGRGAGFMRPALARTPEGREQLLLTNGLRMLAIDPSAAEGGSLENAVEWRWPKEGTVRYWMPTPNGSPQPLVGVAVSGARAYATMFSPQSRQKQDNRRAPDRLDGPAAIRAFDRATGELIWDSDTVEIESGGVRKKMMDQGLPFSGLNFCFAGPPLPRGDALYAVVVTMRPDRQCHVLCLDAATGASRWCTWVGSAPATRERTSVPAIAEEDGTLVVSTGFGIAASLDSSSGAIDWLVKYRGQGSRSAVNAPVFHRSLVYILAQDCDEPLVYDRWTGREAALPELKTEVAWSQVTRLLGRAGECLVFAGSRNLAVNVATGDVMSLGETETIRPAHGTIVDGRLYLPTRTLLHAYDPSTWERRGSFPWPGGEDAGHLEVSGSYCAFLGEKVELFTSLPALQERFAPKVDASPPRAEPCRQFARILESSGRLKESVPYYRRALSVWEKDPAWSERSEELRKKLEDLAEKLGDDFPR